MLQEELNMPNILMSSEPDEISVFQPIKGGFYILSSSRVEDGPPWLQFSSLEQE